MKSLLIATLLALSNLAYGIPPEADRQLQTQRNILLNPGWEAGKVHGWVYSGNAQTLNTSVSNVNSGKQSMSWNATGAGETIDSVLVTVLSGDGISGKPVTASCAFKTPSGSATHVIEIVDNSTGVIQSQTITSSTTWARSTVTATFLTSGSIRLRLRSINANEPLIYIDDCYLGQAEGFNMFSQISQATFHGSVSTPSTASCSWTGTGTTWTSFAADADCPVATVTGKVTAPATKIPAITFSTLPPGEYQFFVRGKMECTTVSVAGNCGWRLWDGTTQIGAVQSIRYDGNANSGTLPQLMGRMTVLSTRTNVTVEIQAQRLFNSTSYNITPEVDTGAGYGAFEISVFRFPTQSEEAIALQNLTWIVDANISGANPALGTVDVASYTGIENASLTLTNNNGPNSIAAKIPCSSTNAPTGTTCSVGNESVGVSFDVPSGGLVEACFDFGANIELAAGTTAHLAFQIVETPNNAQTISQEGKGRMPTSATNAAGLFTFPHKACGILNLSQGQRTIRLFYELDTTGAVVGTSVIADALAAIGQRDIHIVVKPLTYGAGTAIGLLSNLVTTTATNGVRSEYVTFGGATVNTTTCTSSPCTIWRSSDALTNVTRAGAGLYDLNWAVAWSEIPSCTIATCKTSGEVWDIPIYDMVNSTTSVTRIQVKNTAGTNTDRCLIVDCKAKR